VAVSGHLVGIDLGTTNSSVAVLSPRGPEVIVVDEATGKRSVPSVVALSEDDVLTLQSWDASHGAVFYSFKRIIGLRPDEIAASVRDCLRYKILEDGEGHGCLVSYGGGQTTTPIALSSAVVRHLVDVSSAYYGCRSDMEQTSKSTSESSVHGAVIAVPAHFTPTQKQATIDAAREAGVEVVHLLQEPVAAALAYGIDGGTDGETVLVFDWGGGTFDVSVLQAFEGIMEILGTDGNQFLGGDDIDQLLVRSVVDVDVDVDDSVLRGACRSAKEGLAEADEARIYVEGVVDRAMTRDDLERLCEPLFVELATVLDRIGKDLFIEWRVGPFEAISGHDRAMKRKNDTDDREGRDGIRGGKSRDPWAPPPRTVTKVVLVGQITRLQMVVDYIRRVTGIDPDCSVDPGEAVAIGAATQAGILDGSVGSVELMDGSYSIDLHDRTTGFSNWQP